MDDQILEQTPGSDSPKDRSVSRFASWLEGQLRERGWSRSEFARRGGISSSMVDKVITGFNEPGLEFLRATARAFRLPLEDVLRIAGILPPASGRDRTTAQLIARLDELSPNLRAAVLRAWEADLDLVAAVSGEIDRRQRLARLLDNLSSEQYAEASRILDELLAREGKGAGAGPETPPEPPPTEDQSA